MKLRSSPGRLLEERFLGGHERPWQHPGAGSARYRYFGGEVVAGCGAIGRRIAARRDHVIGACRSASRAVGRRFEGNGSNDLQPAGRLA